MNNLMGKIYGAIFIWLVLTGAAFFFIFPKFAAGLIALQQSHQDQIVKYNGLQAQVQSLYQMQQDLDRAQKAQVDPADLFTSDVQLVNEIQHIEDVAKLSNNQLKLTITGTAADAQAYPSFSKLYEVPYTITLTGNLASTLQFLSYFENSFFISPVKILDIENQAATPGGTPGSGPAVAGQVKTNIVPSFFIHRPDLSGSSANSNPNPNSNPNGAN